MLTDWLKINIQTLSLEELTEFDNVVFNIENPQLKRYLVMNEQLRPEHKFPIMLRLQDYV